MVEACNRTRVQGGGANHAHSRPTRKPNKTTKNQQAQRHGAIERVWCLGPQVVQCHLPSNEWAVRGKLEEGVKNQPTRRIRWLHKGQQTTTRNPSAPVVGFQISRGAKNFGTRWHKPVDGCGQGHASLLEGASAWALLGLGDSIGECVHEMCVG